MSAQHTPGRLRLFDTYVDPEIRDDNEKLVAVVLAEKANSARRLVACWNACEMVSTEHLEKYGMPDFAQKISDLREQNTELLAALKSAWLWMENQSDAQSKGGHATFDLMMLRYEREMARAAIAKAGGEA